MKRNELINAFSPIPDDCYNALMAAARSVKEEPIVKKKLSFVLVVILILILATGAALAVVSWRDTARQIVENEQTDGYYQDWIIEKKIALVGALVEQGYTEKTKAIEGLLAGALPSTEAVRIADDALVAFTGMEVSEISFMEIMQAAWGAFERWSKEEQAWYAQLMADMGLQGADHTLYVLPKGPVDEAQAIAIARREVARGFGVGESALDAYTLITSFQVPEFAAEGDDQPYWYVAYQTPEDMPEEARVFPGWGFWVFIHPETGELLEPVESLVEATRGYHDMQAAWENDPLRQEWLAFSELYGPHFGSVSLEGKAYWSENLRAKVIAKMEEVPALFGDATKGEVAFVYGLPDERAISQERALELAKEALVHQLGIAEEEVYFYAFNLNVFYDITDAEKPLWKFFFRMPSIYHSDAAFARQVLDYYGEERLPNYKVEMDARTGEVVRAFPLDLADVYVSEDWSVLY